MILGLIIGLIVGAILGYTLNDTKWKSFEEEQKKWLEIHEQERREHFRQTMERVSFEDHDFEKQMMKHEQKKKEEEKKKHDEWEKQNMTHIFAAAGVSAFTPELEVASTSTTHHRSDSHDAKSTSHHSSHDSSHSHYDSSHHSSHDSSSSDAGSHHW